MLKSIILRLLALYSIAETLNCPPGTHEDLSGCYRFVTERRPFAHAHEFCMSIGGSLSSIHNGFQNSLIYESAEVENVGNFYIGASIVESSNWTWIDGSSFEYTNWNCGTPSGCGQCVVMSVNGHWSLVECSERHNFVCEILMSLNETIVNLPLPSTPSAISSSFSPSNDTRPLPTTLPTTTESTTTTATLPTTTESITTTKTTTLPTTTESITTTKTRRVEVTTTTIPPQTPPPPTPVRVCEEGWKIYKNFCYYIIRKKTTFLKAAKNCEKESSRLASIHSAEENDFVANLSTTGIDTDIDMMMWIGLRRTGNTFSWTDDTPLDYTNWQAGEPNNLYGKEDCAQMFHDSCQQSNSNENCPLGLWNDNKCRRKSKQAVCKKPAK